MEYRGAPNADLDNPINLVELNQAIQALTRKTTPNADKITNRVIRNLDDSSIQALTNFFNQNWEEGTLPAAWKHADIILIGKPPELENLRPITLTSCIGKLFEHVILNRLQPYIENNNLLPPTILGFGPHLNTQGILLQYTRISINKSPLTALVLS